MSHVRTYATPTLEDYLELVDTLKETFPQADARSIFLGIVKNIRVPLVGGPFYPRSHIVVWKTHTGVIQKKDYGLGWDQVDEGAPWYDYALLEPRVPR
jgi:hypothetical protein